LFKLPYFLLTFNRSHVCERLLFPGGVDYLIWEFFLYFLEVFTRNSVQNSCPFLRQICLYLVSWLRIAALCNVN